MDAAALSALPSPEAITRLEHSALRRTLHSADCPTVWRAWGTGPALVLLHGGHGSWMHWARNIAHLAQHFQVLVPDMPGFGDSGDWPLPARDPSRAQRLVDSLCADVAALAPGQPLHLAGFSFGGAIACALATRLPTLARLALIGSGGHGGPRRDRQALLDWRKCTGPARVQAWRQNLSAFMLHGPVDDLALYIHAQSCLHTRFRSKDMSRSAMALEALSRVRVPVCLLWGQEDVTAVPAEAAQAFIQGRAERSATLVPGAGHWLQYENGTACNDRLTRWFLADQ